MKDILIKSIGAVTELLMKHIFIIIAVVLATYFLFVSGSDKEENWAETKSGCLIAMFPAKPTPDEATWTGECKDGYTSGEGHLKITWSGENAKSNYECTGTMVKGEVHGKASCTIADSTTTGSWAHGYRNGFATSKWDNGASYVGTWKDDKKLVGVLTVPDGKKTELKWFEEKNGCLVWNPNPQPDEEVTWSGACENGYASGNGTLKYLSATIKQAYIGPMVKGKSHGEGVFKWIKHPKPCTDCYKTFKGKFSDNKRETGVYTLYNGKKVKGLSRVDALLQQGLDGLKFDMQMNQNDEAGRIIRRSYDAMSR